MAEPTADPAQIPASFVRDPTATWVTWVQSFKSLDAQFPGQLYLIQANGRYAYFTSAQNRDPIRYDFSAMDHALVR